MKFAFGNYLVMALYVPFMVGVGVIAKKKRQDSLEDYFTEGKNLPWWLIGISMVATIFAADTPLAVTGNWIGIWIHFMIFGLFIVRYFCMQTNLLCFTRPDTLLRNGGRMFHSRMAK